MLIKVISFLLILHLFVQLSLWTKPDEIEYLFNCFSMIFSMKIIVINYPFEIVSIIRYSTLLFSMFFFEDYLVLKNHEQNIEVRWSKSELCLCHFHAKSILSFIYLLFIRIFFVISLSVELFLTGWRCLIYSFVKFEVPAINWC